MTDETIQAVRDCAALALLIGLRSMVSSEPITRREVASKIERAIMDKFPEAFLPEPNDCRLIEVKPEER